MHLLLIVFFVVIAPVIAGAYGAVYDMIVYTFAPDFFIDYRFQQFEIGEKITPIVGAAIIGFSNSWKVGIPIGLILGSLTYLHKNIQKTFRYMIISYSIIIATSLIYSGFALFAMQDQLNGSVYSGASSHLNHTVKVILNMNNYAYTGSLIGTILAIVFHLVMI